MKLYRQSNSMFSYFSVLEQTHPPAQNVMWTLFVKTILHIDNSIVNS